MISYTNYKKLNAMLKNRSAPSFYKDKQNNIVDIPKLLFQ